MEFGPRALGARSILGDPRNPRTQSTMNLKIKYRASFRPFAPAVLRERCADYFEFDADSPYMLMVAPVNTARRLLADSAAFEGGDDNLLAVINQPRSDVPAVTHVDYSARIQTVDTAENGGHPELRALIEAFARLTGCPLLVNTSFNVRGEPIVCTPRDAYRCFMRTEMDVLVLEDVILWRHEQPPMPDDDDWRSTYELD
jgi:carbamoyltransferase